MILSSWKYAKIKDIHAGLPEETLQRRKIKAIVQGDLSTSTSTSISARDVLSEQGSLLLARRPRLPQTYTWDQIQPPRSLLFSKVP